MSVEVVFLSGAALVLGVVALVTFSCYYCYTEGVERGSLEARAERLAAELREVEDSLQASREAGERFDVSVKSADAATLTDHVGLLWSSDSEGEEKPPSTPA